MKIFKITETNKKTSEIMAEMKSLFPVWSYYDDDELDRDFPPPKEITTREFPYSVEPAELNVSAKDGDPNMTGITLRERMLMEIQYFKETGNHLDVVGWTICSGSRFSDGGVPCVDFHGAHDEVNVYWYGVDGSDPAGGLRQPVLPSNPFPSLPLHSDLESRLKNVEQFLRDNFKGFTI